MSETEDLICAYRLDGAGGGQELGWEEVGSAASGGGVLWVHLNRGGERTQAWLEGEAGIDPLIRQALMSDDSRPRCEEFDDGLLISLRGVNLNPGADPEDMVDVDVWVESTRIITVRRRHLMAVDAVRKTIEAGSGPTSLGEFIVALADGLVARMGPVIADLDDKVDALEDDMVDGNTKGMREKLGHLRREAIALRRYFAPQRDAMTRLMNQKADWLTDRDRGGLREVADHITRHVEDLDAARERAQIAQDEMASRVAEQINRNMYVLSIVAVIFLPLGLLTGLLGINVGGMPGEKWHWAFWSVTGLLVVLAVLEIWVFRRLKWI